MSMGSYIYRTTNLKIDGDIVQVEAEIHVEEILRYFGHKAWRSTGKRSRALSGMIKIKTKKVA